MAKYGNRKTERDGYIFDSKAEARHYDELRLRERAGEIHDLVLQPKFDITVNGKHICNYFSDFSYIEKDGSYRVVDVKGVRTDVFILKRKLVAALYGIDIVEVKA
jgi:hypothetical protein